jgi:hypothetical protein
MRAKELPNGFQIAAQCVKIVIADGQSQLATSAWRLTL